MLYNYAQEYFGSWKTAIEAAEIDPDEVAGQAQNAKKGG